MRSAALVVRREDGERIRRELVAADALRTDLEIHLEGDRLVLPLRTGVDLPTGLGPPVEREFAPLRSAGPGDYRELLDWPADRRAALPRSFDVVGDTVLVRIPPELEERSVEIGRALLTFVPGARIVGADRGVHGPERRRRIELLAGTGGWRTTHRENGIALAVDVERAYFSPRLAREHALVAEEVRVGDVVHDLCCGIGPFTALIARQGRARAITAVDANPDAIALLRETIDRLANGPRVSPLVQDVGRFVASAPPAERVILNLPHEGIKYLPSVATTVAPRGRLYYYEVTPRTEAERRGETVVRSFERPEEWKAGTPHVVHPYSPAADLVGYVFERGEGSEVLP